MQVSSPDPSSPILISRGSQGSKPSDSAGDVISMSDEGINSPPRTTSSSKSGQPLAARLSTAVPPPPSVPANMSLTNAASPHRPMQLSYAQALASPGRQHKGGSSANETRTKLSSSEAPLAKVANPYDCPSRRRVTFNDDANETRTFSGADENPWDGYDSALDDESALEEDPTSEDEAGARTGEKAKNVA